MTSPRLTLFAPRTRPRWVVAGITVTFVVVFSVLVLQRFARFNYYAFDLGIFDQGLWLLSRFQDPFITLRGLPLFGDHSSYIVVLLTPLYWIWADVRLLLVFTVALVGAGIPLTYAAARARGLTPWIGVSLAAGYGLHPAVAWLTWDNFHPELIALPLLITAYLFALKGRGWLAFGALALVLACKEDAVLVVVPFAIYLGVGLKQRGPGIAAAVLGIVVAFLNFQVLLPNLTPGGDLLYADRYQAWGDGFLGIAWGVASRPFAVLETIFEAERLKYLAAMLLSLPTALLVPGVLLAAAPITLANLLTTFFYQYDIKYHYNVYLAAIVTIAAISGTARLARRGRPALYAGTAVLLMAALIGHVAVSPSPLGFNETVWPPGTDERQAIEQALSFLPDDAAVAAEASIATHLSHRVEIYEFPSPFIRWKWGSPASPDPDPARADWVVARLSFLDDWRDVIDPLLTDPEWEIAYENWAMIVLQRR